MAEDTDRGLAARAMFATIVEGIEALNPPARHAAYGILVERLADAARYLVDAMLLAQERRRTGGG